MSNCHQSCLTCDGADEKSCTSCSNTSYLAEVDNTSKGYCVPCNSTEEVSGTRGIRGCRTCELSSGTLICTDCIDLDDMVSINRTACVSYCEIGAAANYYTRQCQCAFGHGLAHGGRDNGCIRCAASGCDVCDDNSDICIECRIPLGLSADKKQCLAVGGCRANCVCDSGSTDAETRCTSCKPSYFLQPTTPLCLHNCPVGYFANVATTKCELCPPGCYSCNSATSGDCTSCADGYVLKAKSSDLPLAGECVAECTETAAGDCLVCDVVIRDARYCSKCRGSSFPLDGRCTPVSSETASICMQDTDGACSKCGAGYFLHQGGCYSTLHDPGKLVCAAAERRIASYYGTCRMCATAYHRTSTGTCVKCAVDGCIACFSDPGVCTACNVGYYAKLQNPSSDTVACHQCVPGCTFCTDETPRGCSVCERGYFSFSSTYGCIRCDDTGAPGRVTGVSGCKQCMPPPSMGHVICLDDNPNSPFRIPNRARPGTSNRIILVLSIALPVVLIVAVLVGIVAWLVFRRRRPQSKTAPPQTITIES